MLSAAAVDLRIELDLRTGAAITRLQTLNLQGAFPELAEKVISYGSSQPLLPAFSSRPDSPFLSFPRSVSVPNPRLCRRPVSPYPSLRIRGVLVHRRLAGEGRQHDQLQLEEEPSLRLRGRRHSLRAVRREPGGKGNQG